MALAEFLDGAPEGAARVSTRACRRIRSTRWRARQMRGFGGLIAFDARLARSGAHACSNSVRLMALAESLGGVETLISHPAIDDARLGARRSGAPRSASPTAWSASRPASRTSRTCKEDLDAGARPRLNRRCVELSTSSPLRQAPARFRRATTGRGSTRSCSRSCSPRPASSSRRSCRAIRCCSRPARWRDRRRSTRRLAVGLLVAGRVRGQRGQLRRRPRRSGRACSSAQTDPRSGRWINREYLAARARVLRAVRRQGRSCSAGSCRSCGRSCRSSPAPRR